MTNAAIAQNFINGEWLGGADTRRMNPARPGKLAVVSPSSSAQTLDQAISAAVDAQVACAEMPMSARGAILITAGNLLFERKRSIAEDLVREEGKTIAESLGEVGRAIDVLGFFCSLGSRRVSICAGSGAVANARIANEESLISVVAVCMNQAGEPQVTNLCGVCRELMSTFGPDISVLADVEGTVAKAQLVELLPMPWTRAAENSWGVQELRVGNTPF